MKNIWSLSKIEKGIIVLAILVVIISLSFWSIETVKTNRKLEVCQKQYPWWEMVKENCGYDKAKDQQNDYCRGFRDGYDYASQMKQLDEQLKELK